MSMYLANRYKIWDWGHHSSVDEQFRFLKRWQSVVGSMVPGIL